jgi:aspartyl-tRNA synthetase
MSFVTQDDVFAAIEPVLAGVFQEFAEGRSVSPAPFPRIPYAEAMLHYGSDKPDLRNPLKIADVKPIFDREDVSFKAFKNKEAVRAIPAPGAAAQPRSWFDKMVDWAKGEGAAGLGYIVFTEETVNTPGSVASSVADAMEQVGVARKAELSHLRFLEGKGPIAKFLSAEAIQELALATGARRGSRSATNWV